MSLSVGIIGLPNVGKSTLFKALTKKQVDIANYPFTTIEPNVAVVAVPDENLDKLVEILSRQGDLEKVTPAVIEFIDIAGLVKEAHLGKGLGNKFLAKIREANILVEVVRKFENKNVPHVENSIDPERDIKIIEEELKEAGIEKPIIYFFNTDLKDQLEMDDLNEEERKELGLIKSSQLDDLIKKCYQTLDLITFYTIKGGKEVRATKLKRGEDILEAAGKIHDDFREKFIKAEVVNVKELIGAGSWLGAREKGLIRTEGKDYIVRDGDVIEFKI
jgi:small GTP-binding protein